MEAGSTNFFFSTSSLLTFWISCRDLAYGRSSILERSFLNSESFIWILEFRMRATLSGDTFFSLSSSSYPSSISFLERPEITSVSSPLSMLVLLSSSCNTFATSPRIQSSWILVSSTPMNTSCVYPKISAIVRRVLSSR